MKVRVIGIGTRHGDDAAGLAVAHRLGSTPLPAGVSVVGCERPGLDLLEDLADAEVLVLVDAMRSGRPAGTLHSVLRDQLRSSGSLSNHGLGVAEALDLASALGRVPRRVEIVGIEAGGASEGELSPAVARGVEAAVEHLRALLADILDEPRRGRDAHA